MVASMEEILVRDLSYDAHRAMYKLLAPSTPGRDWKTLADKMGYSNEEIRYYECFSGRAVDNLIQDYEERGKKTVSELLLLLGDMGRMDVINDLQKFLDVMPTPAEVESRQKNIEKNKEFKTFSESYDAFVCYAKADIEFAKEIVSQLEGAPYHMRLCIDYRDFVPGTCYYETAAAVIAKRCKKVLVILSENFNNCENADQQAKMALCRSPAAKGMVLIPILYKACEVPLTMKFITYLDYTREDSKEYFWNKLAETLGYIYENKRVSFKPKNSTPPKKSGTSKKLCHFWKSTLV